MPFQDMSDKITPQIDPVAAMQPQFVKDFAKYSVSNPHPGFGKDPNILNEFGHTKYPMMVYPHGKDHDGVIVNNPDEEAKALGKEPEALNPNGPTIQEYVEKGYPPDTYPPKGCAKKSSDEEIKAAIAAHNNKGW